jgi:hypothetical protein
VTLREYIDTRLDALDKALELQARELARRLDELNHSHSRSLEDRNLFVTKDEYKTGHTGLVSTVETLRDTVQQWRGRDTVVAVGISMLASFVMLAIAHLWK